MSAIMLIMLKELGSFKAISTAFIFIFQNIFQLQQDDTTPECFLCAIWIPFINYIILLYSRFFF